MQFKNQAFIKIRRFIHLTRTNSNLVNFGDPEDVSLSVFRNLLWVAKDMKELVKENNRSTLNLLNVKHITLCYGTPHRRFVIAYSLACELLGARKSIYYDPSFHYQTYDPDMEMALSGLTDMLIINGGQRDTFLKLHKTTPFPVFSASDDVHSIHRAFSNLFTIQEHFNGLKGLTVALIGPPSTFFNSFLLLCSKFGIVVQYNCVCKYGTGKMSPINAMRWTMKFNAQIHEYQTTAEAVKNANAIITSLHWNTESSVTPNMLDSAKKNWIYIHNLPRSNLEASEEVINHKNNYTWHASENYLYIAMAIILETLSEYKCKTEIVNTGEPKL